MAASGKSREYGFNSAHVPAPQPMRKGHSHQEIELNYLGSGRLVYLLNGQLVTIPARRWVVFWAALPHRLVSVQDAQGFHWFTVPLAWVLGWPLPQEFIKAILHGAVMGPLTRTAPPLAQWHGDLKRRTRPWQNVVALEMQATLTRVALGGAVAPGQAKGPEITSAGLRRVEAMSRFLAAHYHEDIRPADAARHVGLHPNYAMSLFREIAGQTMLECLTQHRLSHARRLLATTERKILDVALESGFGSASRFYAAFFAASAQTPRAYRQSMRLSAPRQNAA